MAALWSCCSLFWANQAHVNSCLDGGIAVPARPLLQVSAAATGRLPRVQPDPHLVHGSTPLTLDGESCLSADELNQHRREGVSLQCMDEPVEHGERNETTLPQRTRSA